MRWRIPIAAAGDSGVSDEFFSGTSDLSPASGFWTLAAATAGSRAPFRNEEPTSSPSTAASDLLELGRAKYPEVDFNA